MKTETLHQAIDFVLGSPRCQQYINDLESAPDEYAIVQIGASVVDYQNSIVRVWINFKKRIPDGKAEDALVDVQGTYFGDFRVLNITPVHLAP
jgi:hypothetical protein